LKNPQEEKTILGIKKENPNFISVEKKKRSRKTFKGGGKKKSQENEKGFLSKGILIPGIRRGCKTKGTRREKD